MPSRSETRRWTEALLTSVLRAGQFSVCPADTYLKAEVNTSFVRKVCGHNLPDAEQYLNRIVGGAHVYAFPKADVATDAVVFGLDMTERKLKVLLIQRGFTGEPFEGCWAFPGGFLNMKEDPEKGVLRELREETHVDLSFLEQLYTFGRPDRDPRGRVLSIAYWGIVRPDQVVLQADDDAASARWFPVENLPPLAFDHAEILDMAIRRLRGKLRWQPVGVWLLPEEFSLSQLHDVYEVILGRPLDRANFSRKLRPILDFGVLEKTGNLCKPVAGRPAKTYRFNPEAYRRLQQHGLDFEV